MVAVVGAGRVGSLRDRAQTLGSGRMQPLALVGAMRERTAAISDQVARHLYVYDGDLRSEDALQRRIAAEAAASDRDGARLRPARRRHPGRPAGRDGRVDPHGGPGGPREISGLIGEIQEQTRAEVAAVAEQSSASAEQVSSSTQETSASTQQIAASASDLASTAEQLEQLVRCFRVTA